MESFVEHARKVIAENQHLFLTLEELDRTGKIRKATYKGRFSISIDEDLMARFRSHCLKHGLKMSTLIEKFIKDYIKKSE
ncbi:MAG TPA: ribbon-helix-helix protein, CopG family [Candidatus Nanoarchaeia archaeon]|nr:ribbon-helix-helix protein, CopG family [Candidatus Nanoarchaeia archaeon]